MSEPLEEAGNNLQAAKDRAVEAREAVEGDPGEVELEDEGVWDAIDSALYDMDYALAKATWTTKDYMNQAADAADEGYDDLVEELVDARRGLIEFREALAESRPSRAIAKWLSSMEERLDAMLDRLRGEGED
jgi:hypothetical protein